VNLLEIEDGIHLIKNPHNTYFVSSVLISGDSLTLIDAGRAESPNTSIYPAIKALGRNPKEISLIILTHAHWDHCAGAAQIIRDTGCDIAVHRNGEEYLREPESVVKELHRRFPGIPTGNMGKLDPIESMTMITDGYIFDLDERELKIIHTPGHSSCSCCIVEPDIGLYISGDSIQGRGENRPLLFHNVRDYIESMNDLLDEPIKAMVNGHPFPPSNSGLVRGDKVIIQVKESIKAVEQLVNQVLVVLKNAKKPLSILEIYEEVKASRPFTIGCVLEALELESKATREKLGEQILWRKAVET
jgi:glyoxylase-like metal-dependent hydrolase (beta-lactamase superfamily II)